MIVAEGLRPASRTERQSGIPVAQDRMLASWTSKMLAQILGKLCLAFLNSHVDKIFIQPSTYHFLCGAATELELAKETVAKLVMGRWVERGCWNKDRAIKSWRSHVFVHFISFIGLILSLFSASTLILMVAEAVTVILVQSAIALARDWMLAGTTQEILVPTAGKSYNQCYHRVL